MPGHRERHGLHLQHLGLVLAKTLQRSAADRAGTLLRLNQVRDTLKMLRQLFAPYGLALGALRRFDLLGRSVALRFGQGGFDLLEGQRQLSGALKLLRGLPEADAL